MIYQSCRCTLVLKTISYPQVGSCFFHSCAFARRPLHSLALRAYIPSVHSSLRSRATFAALPATMTEDHFVVSLIYQPTVPLLRALNRASTCTRYFKIALTHIRSSFYQFVATSCDSNVTNTVAHSFGTHVYHIWSRRR